jgi:hypothetical protein
MRCHKFKAPEQQSSLINSYEISFLWVSIDPSIDRGHLPSNDGLTRESIEQLLHRKLTRNTQLLQYFHPIEWEVSSTNFNFLGINSVSTITLSSMGSGNRLATLKREKLIKCCGKINIPRKELGKVCLNTWKMYLPFWCWNWHLYVC